MLLQYVFRILQPETGYPFAECHFIRSLDISGKIGTVRMKYFGQFFYGKSLLDIAVCLYPVGHFLYNFCIGHWNFFLRNYFRFCFCSALITVSFEHESQLKIIQGSYEKIYVGHSPNGYNRYYRSGGFRGLANLTTFDASNCSQIESIEPSAFYHCSKLQSVKVGTMIPPTCGIDAFSELNSYTILTVPKESIEAYKQANEWKNFTNITALN